MKDKNKRENSTPKGAAPFPYFNDPMPGREFPGADPAHPGDGFPGLDNRAPGVPDLPDYTRPAADPPVPNRAWTAMRLGMDIDDLTPEERLELYPGRDNLF